MGPQCVRCSLPLHSAILSPVCGSCQRKPPPLEHCHALLAYEPLVGSLIHALKFGQQLHIARSLGKLMAANAPPTEAQALLPVPLHTDRLRQRGYNQALELARPLAKKTGLPLVVDAVVRQNATAAQAELSAEQRRKNLRKAFAVKHPLPWNHVVLVDDVMTTGSTLFELAETLKKAGVQRVDAWLCARAV